jgi:hypothetical protein
MPTIAASKQSYTITHQVLDSHLVEALLAKPAAAAALETPQNTVYTDCR